MIKHKFDASKDVVNITWKTLQDLFDNGTPDAIALYMRYCYIAQLKGNTIVDANNIYMMNGTKLTKYGLTKAKKILVDLGYIKNEYFGDGIWKVKVNHLVTNSKMRINSTSSTDEEIEKISTSSNSIRIDFSPNTERYNLIQKDLEEEEDRENFSHSNVNPPTTDAAYVDKKESTAIATITIPAHSVKDTVNEIYQLSIKAFNNKETERLTTTTIARTKKLLALGHTIEEFKTIFSKCGAWSQKTPRLLAVVVKNEQTFNGLLNFQDLRETESKNKITEIRSTDYVPDTERVSKWDQYK